MKKRLTPTLLIAMALVFAFSGAFSDAIAQRVWFRGNVREIIRQLESDTDRFKSSLDHALDNSPLNGTRREDEIHVYVKRLEEATIVCATVRKISNTPRDWREKC